MLVKFFPYWLNTRNIKMTKLKTPLALTTALCIVLSACSANIINNDTLTTDVIGIKEVHLSPDFWSEQASNGKKVIFSNDEIDAINRQNLSQVSEMAEIFKTPSTLSKDTLISKIKSVSRHSKNDRSFADGTEVTQEFYDKLNGLLNLDAVKDINPVSFGMIVRRSDLRTFPSSVRLFTPNTGTNIDRYQESVLFPADAVAILHESKDHNWVLVRAYNYLAWVKKENVAYGDKASIEAFKNAREYLVVTGDKVRTTYNPQAPEVSDLQLDMGIRLPLADRGEVDNSLYGQNPYTSHIIKLPTRNVDGSLTFKNALIARNKDTQKGYLAHSKNNLIKQAFKFLGERYGWGHMYNGRDCSGFVAEVYKSMGLLIPRNSGTQGRSAFGQNIRFTSETPTEERLKHIKNLEIGDLIYIPGHVMMFIGTVDGNPYIIHDVSGLQYTLPDGTLYKGTLNGVSVTPLLPMKLSAETSYIDKIFTIKKIR